jgi:tripartite-type tricarboxylate transporter receptor subunit TctC
MNQTRRRFIKLAGAATLLPAALHIARAQGTYPNRPVKVIVGQAAGSASDIVARLIGQFLSEKLGQQFIVEVRPGAAGNIATEAVAHMSPDGYTLLLLNSQNAINVALYDKLNFDFVRDIAPVGMVERVPLVMEVHPSVPAKSIPEFIAYAKANPGKINLGSSGTGFLGHLAGELFRMTTGIEWVHVPFRGVPGAHAAMLAGEVQVMFDSVASSLPHVQSGALRALGISAKTRMRVLPDVPSISDSVPGYEGTGWLGFGAPKGTPAEIVEKLNREISTILADPAINARLLELGSVPFTSSSADFAKLVAAETEKWAKVVKFASVKGE